MTSATSTLLDRLTPPDFARPGEPAWMREDRARARAWLRANGLPTARDEAWKYTPLADILSMVFEPAPIPLPADIDMATIDELAGNHGGLRLVFVNGSFAADLSRTRPTPRDVVFGHRASLLAERPGAMSAAFVASPDRSRFDGFQAINHAAADDDTAVVRVGPDTDVVEPIHVVHLSVPGKAPTASHPHTVVEVAAGSRLTVIETYAGLPGRSMTNAATAIAVGSGARVTHYKIQNEAAESVHVAHTNIRQGAGSEVHSCTVMLGADIARNAVDVVLGGAGATLDVDGLYLPTGSQRHDNVVTIEHASSSCTSRQLFKGVIDDHARGSFSGRIIVGSNTVATDAGQTSRSLLLKPTAEADSRPWLEIFTDDVKCTHGATVGRLDEEAMFYMRSRGIAESDARAMLIGGFVNEIIEGVRPETLRADLEITTARVSTRAQETMR
jgi:Fe-S cluster assembly protein SufD